MYCIRVSYTVQRISDSVISLTAIGKTCRVRGGPFDLIKKGLATLLLCGLFNVIVALFPCLPLHFLSLNTSPVAIAPAIMAIAGAQRKQVLKVLMLSLVIDLVRSKTRCELNHPF